MVKGLPASGKSTFAKEFVKNTAKSLRINNDDLRASFYDRKFNKEDEEFITYHRNQTIDDALKSGYTVVVDNTNLNPIHEDILKLKADKYDVIFEIKEFPVDVETCVARDKLRSDKVGEKVIRSMAKQWNYYPEPPREFEKVVQSFGKDAFIFDIDGTLAYMNGRSPYDYSRVSTDGCYEDIAEMLKIVSQNYSTHIIICSGRKEECRLETIQWLSDYGIHFNKLLMRKSEDNRKDSIVKYEMLVNYILPQYYVKGVFDDRDQVVKMWREAGLRCYQVNYGNF